MHYGNVAGSAPSFINSRSESSTSDYGNRRRSQEDSLDETEEEEEERDEEEEEDDQDTPRRRVTDIPGVFDYGDDDLPSEPDKNRQGSTEDLKASVSTIMPLKNGSSSRRLPPGTGRRTPASGSRSTSILGTSSGSRGSFGGTIGNRILASPQPITDEASLISGGEEESLDVATPLRESQAANQTRRRSTVGARRPSIGGSPVSDRRGSTRLRRKSMVVMESGESTDGQTVCRPFMA